MDMEVLPFETVVIKVEKNDEDWRINEVLENPLDIGKVEDEPEGDSVILGDTIHAPDGEVFDSENFTFGGSGSVLNTEKSDEGEELQYHQLSTVTQVATQSLPSFPDQSEHKEKNFVGASLLKTNVDSADTENSEDQNSIKNSSSVSGAVQSNINQFDLIEIYKSDGLNSEPPLLTLLRNHPQGFNVLNSYKLNGTLTKAARNLLARLIIHKEHEKKATVDCLPAQRYLELSNDICTLFKSENPNTYYTPHVSANGGIGAKSAYGILLSCNNYLRKQRLKQNSAPSTILSQISTEKPNLAVSESFLYVQKFIEPWADVQLHWRNSYEERKRELTTLSTSEYFTKFPCLKQAKGYELLENDFDVEFSEYKKAITTNWPTVRNQLIHLFKGPRRPSNPEYSEILAKLNTFQDDALNLIILSLLSVAFPKPRLITSKNNQNIPKKRRRGKKDESDSSELEKGWNPSKSEAKDGFIFHVKTTNDIHSSLKKLQTTLAPFKLPLQPRPIFVGSYDSIISYHVIVDDVQYDIESSIRALEVCFKIYYALNLDYPPEAKAPWQFIEQAVFKMKNTNIPTSVAALLGELSVKFAVEN